ncbi:MAG: Gfo/Idh/MocA family protein, partial [Enterococcus hulanensis]
MSKLKIGIIGCGGIANQKHFPALTLQKDKAEMVAFCDIEVERAKEACEKYGVEGAQYYEDYNELLADPSINVVHVCTPNVSHSPIAVAAFEAGKNVLCEKPMAHNTEAAQKMM